MWIQLSVCNSFTTLPYVQFLIQKCGIEHTLDIIKNFTGIKDIPSHVIDSFPNKNVRKINWEKNITYCRDMSKIKNFEKILDNSQKIKVKIITPEHKFWPQKINFLNLEKPLAIWAIGENLQMLNAENCVSIVGSRKCSNYGKNIAIDLGYELSMVGVTVISGGAIGIDSYSHIGAINGGGNTISVLAGGLDKMYPATNISLFNSILEKGIIISENPIGTRPAKWKFLERNRLIAALSDITVLVEAPEKSGSLNTANYAVEYGKTVGVVPGNVDSSFSNGTNFLLKQGAYPICSKNDVLELLPSYTGELFSFENNDTLDLMCEKRIISSLYKTRVKTLEELFLECELDIKQIIKTLGFLEMKGICVKKENGWVLA